ncbi:hypothetical protein AWENTII_000160 [Aspergillus wentii]
MSWAADRKTTRTEDVAYCLMGIFGINMPLLYGEGKNAFIGLQEEIMKDSDDQSLFAWEHLEEDDDCPIGLLAKSPLDFKNSGSIIPFYFVKDRMPCAVTNRGIRLQLPLSSSSSHLILECQDTSTKDSICGKGLYGKGDTSARTVGCPLFDQNPYGFSSTTTAYATGGEKLHLKNLVICFQEPRNVAKNLKSLSNVERIYNLLDCTNASQIHYSPVVSGKHVDNVVECVNDAYAWLMKHHNPHDRIYIFGFSVGGWAAQDLARMLENIGLLSSNFNKNIEVIHAFREYCFWKSATLGGNYYVMQERTRYWDMRELREKYCRPIGKVSFLGIFDAARIDTGFKNTTYWSLNLPSRISSSGCIVRHAVSIDERSTRLPTLAASDVTTEHSENIQELWFSGCHADICGTAPVKPGDELGPGHIPLAWMIRKAVDAGLHVDKRKLMHEFGLDGQGQLESLGIDSILASDELISAIRIASTKGILNRTLDSKKLSSLQCVIKYALRQF